MLFHSKPAWRDLLKECDHDVAAAALMHYLAEHVPSAELAGALEGYFQNPGYQTALKVVRAEPELILLFRESRPGGVYQRLVGG